jgi:1-deoxy-D-xylulose-5-phosphate reductoisomerase
VTHLVVLGATRPFGLRAIQAAAEHELGGVTIAEQAPSDALLALAAAHPDAALVLTGTTPTERVDFAARFGDRISFGAAALGDVVSDDGRVVVSDFPGLSGLSTSVSALEAGNRLVLESAQLVARSGVVMSAAALRGGGDLVVGGQAGSLSGALVAAGIAPPFDVNVVGDGGPLHGTQIEEIERLAPGDVVGCSPGAVARAVLADAGYALIGAHLLCGGGAVGFGVHRGEWDAVVQSGDEAWGHRPADDVIGRALGDLDVVGGSLEQLQSVPDLEEPPEIGRRIVGAAVEALGRSGTGIAAFGAASDVGIRAFLDRRVGLSTIPEIVERAMDAMPDGIVSTVDDVLAADREARELATSLLGGMC